MRHSPNQPAERPKPEHVTEVRDDTGPAGFRKGLAESGPGDGGLPQAQLAARRADFAPALNGVGRSIGGPWRLGASPATAAERAQGAERGHDPHPLIQRPTEGRRGPRPEGGCLMQPRTPTRIATVMAARAE